MELFDDKFEGMRLSMLSSQFPESLQYLSKIVFLADNDGNELHCRYFFMDNISREKTKLTEFQRLLSHLLTDLIKYRKQYNIIPSNEGIIDFVSSGMVITWVDDGSSELSDNDGS